LCERVWGGVCECLLELLESQMQMAGSATTQGLAQTACRSRSLELVAILLAAAACTLCQTVAALAVEAGLL